MVAGPTIGGCRTFFNWSTWFDGQSKPQAEHSRFAYKAYIKALSVKAKRGAGYRPTALKRIVDYEHGPTERSATIEQLKRKHVCFDCQPGLVRTHFGSAARAPSDRLHWRPTGEREAIGDRPTMRLRKAETPATHYGQSVVGYRRDRWASDVLVLVPRNRRSA